MQLLITYVDQLEAEAAEKKITGKKRLASDRDDNEVIYRLFGDPTWGNFYQLGMYALPELKEIVDRRKAGLEYDADRHRAILDGLGFVQSTYGLKVPDHWL
ncbi:hypothetical protein HW115_14695 [Verrucomicrobiaceae bacterium N1E253]|uniref:Uncharacterized protein n=1 Tax=Oceaniferula marina TaxID=2748318 RepID=A0A851GI46_9BACT|nr:hypothetical protein [Oceaniferula marina]NWK56869.1 hypothetical protein [Oceaniferula marina]